MDLKRFEKAINDGADTRDEVLTTVLKDLLEEHKKLKADAIPGFMHQLRDRLKNEQGDGYWIFQFLIVPVAFFISILACLGIAHCGAELVESHVNDIQTQAIKNEWVTGPTFYYLSQDKHDEYGQCTRVMVKVKGFQNSEAATECFKDPLEAAKLLNILEQRER